MRIQVKLALAVGLSIASLILNLYLAYQVVDIGIALSYARDEQSEASMKSRACIAAINAEIDRADKEAILDAAGSAVGEVPVPYPKRSSFVVGNLEFLFTDDALVRVRDTIDYLGGEG